MIEVALPVGPASPLVRSLAACLSSVTEVPLPDLPDLGDAPVRHALGACKSWLARVRADPDRRRGGRGPHGTERRARLRQHAAQRLTRGIDVNALVGRGFTIGDVRCRGLRLAEPCAHLERLHGPGLLRPLIHRGGLRVDVLSDGEIRPGSEIST